MNRLHLVCILLLITGNLIAQEPKAIEVQTGIGKTSIKVYPGVKSAEVFSPEEKRFGLVLGVSDYDHLTPLPCVKNDVDTVRRALQKTGFDVAVAIDKNKADFEAIIDESRQYCIDNGYNIITIYYSGHGAQFGSVQMLAPKDFLFTAKDTSGRLKEFMDNSILLPTIIGKLNIPNAKAVLAISDACRSEDYAKQNTESPIIPSYLITKFSNIQKTLEGTGNVGVLYSSLNGATSATAPIISVFTQYLLSVLAKKPGNFGDLAIRIAKEMQDKGENQSPVNTNNPIKYDFKFFRGGIPPIITSIVASPPNTPSQFNPNLTYGTVTDVEGNQYKTIKIGSQTWMADNLNTSTYANGDPIPNVTSSWKNQTSGAWCYYDNNNSYKTPIGKLYNGYAVVDGRNLCPNGWSIPNYKDWNILVNYLDGLMSAGTKMMTTDSTWKWKSVTINNSSGFNAYPTGNLEVDGVFRGMGWSSYWWCLSNPGVTWFHLRFSDGYIMLREKDSDFSSGFAVRCIKD